MTTTLIAQVDNTEKLEHILALFNRLQIPFKNMSTDSVDVNTAVVNFKEQDADWESVSLKMLAEDTDWNSSFDDHWGEMYNKTKNI